MKFSKFYIKDFIIAHYIHYGEFPSEYEIDKFAEPLLRYSSTYRE